MIFKCHLGALRVVLRKNVRKQTPPKMAIPELGDVFGSPQSRNDKYAIMSTLILKCHLGALRVVFRKNVRKQTPPKMANFGGVYFLTFFQKTNRFGARRASK